MAYKLTITQKPTYLHAVVSGRNNRETVVAYLEEILRECVARDCFSLLIEERLEGPRLSTLDVFEIVSHVSDQSRGVMKAVAYVDLNREGDSMRFAETVAVNRGLSVTVFSTVSEAEDWLLDPAA